MTPHSIVTVTQRVYLGKSPEDLTEMEKSVCGYAHNVVFLFMISEEGITQRSISLKLTKVGTLWQN